MDTGQEQNYWPGFVDALSNVVLTLVFVLVIFVFALAMSANKVEEKMKQVTQAEEARVQEDHVITQQRVESQQEVDKLRQQLAQAQADLAALQSKNVGKSKVDDDIGAKENKETSNVAESKEIVVEKQEKDLEAHQGAVSLKSDQTGIVTLSFPESVSDIDEKSQGELDTMIKAAQASTGAKKIVIKSIMGNESYSAAQRIAYYRALNVRNFLMTKLGIQASAISSSIVKPDNPEAGRVEIIFKKD